VQYPVGRTILNGWGMAFRRTTRFAVVSLIAASAAGCAVGPDFKRPPPPAVKGYTSAPLPPALPAAGGLPAQTFVQGQDIPAQWWTLFHSPALNRLVERALKANPNLQAAEATLRQAQETYYAGRGELFPSVNASGTVNHEKIVGAQFGNPNFPGTMFTLYNASVGVSYGLDFFGLTRRSLEALVAQEDYQRFELESAYLTLTSNVVTAALQEASLRAQIAATSDIVDVQSQQLAIMERQLSVGAIAEVGVVQQRTALAQTRATLPALQKQLAQVRNQIAVLVGDFPGQGEPETFDLESLQLPQELPVSLPSRLVEQRPDIRASEALLHAANAQIGVATAEELPQLTLTGNVGSVATSANRLFKAGSGIWSIGANIVQPLFRGGTLLHQKRAAVAAHDAAVAHYRDTVLAAFQDVANVLDALQFDGQTLQSQLQASQSAAEGVDIARKQYQVGAANFLVLLNAQQAYAQTRIALAQARASRYADTAALFQALGGGWWNRGAGGPDGKTAKAANDAAGAQQRSSQP